MVQDTQLQNHFSSELHIQTISQDKLQKIFDRKTGGGWNKFRKQYPKASSLIRLSNIVYSPDGQKGLFYLSISGGMLNGAGYYIYFDLGGTNKIIKAQIWLWIS